MPSSDPHLLRTFAAVPPGQRVLDLGNGRHAQPLTQLGFDVTVCRTLPEVSDNGRSVPDRSQLVTVDASGTLPLDAAAFDWIVLWGAWPSARARRMLLLAEARRVIKPGGWIYLSVPRSAADSANAVTRTMEEAAWAVAEPVVTIEHADRCLHHRGIFRRVETGTSA